MSPGCESQTPAEVGSVSADRRGYLLRGLPWTSGCRHCPSGPLRVLGSRLGRQCRRGRAPGPGSAASEWFPVGEHKAERAPSPAEPEAEVHAVEKLLKRPPVTPTVWKDRDALDQSPPAGRGRGRDPGAGPEWYRVFIHR